MEFEDNKETKPQLKSEFVNAKNLASATPLSLSSTLVRNNRCFVATIVYLALLLDNVLLTVIVPILPDYLATLNVEPNVALNEESLKISTVDNDRFVTLSYRNLNAEQQQQTKLSKHPISGKLFVNFSQINAAPELRLLSNAVDLKPLPHIFAATTRDNSKANNRILHNNRNNKATNSKEIDAGKDKLSGENGSIGILLATKAFVQLIFNPIVGNLTSKIGYRIPILVGTFFLLLSSITFAIGESYFTLLLGRAIQGIASACITISGMSLVAQHYPEEDRRSKVMGIILGSIALGVLIGYPFGGFLYDLNGKSAPFTLLSIIILLNLGLQFLTLDISIQSEAALQVDDPVERSKWMQLLADKLVKALVLAIWFSTSTMAILEPCLPIWLMQNLKPSKWQLGTVFIPDSLGYFVGTNFFGTIAYKYGQVKIACLSLLLVGVSSISIPTAQTVSQLMLPHFVLGLGIGIIDAALVPLLATIVDTTLSKDNDQKSNEHSISTYGTIYALQQTSVSLAYFLAPLIGGLLAEAVGFIWLMRIVGLLNIVYGPILVYIYQQYEPRTLGEKRNEMLLLSSNERHGSQYKQLYNSIEIE